MKILDGCGHMVSTHLFSSSENRNNHKFEGWYCFSFGQHATLLVNSGEPINRFTTVYSSTDFLVFCCYSRDNLGQVAPRGLIQIGDELPRIPRQLCSLKNRLGIADE